ncbi:MAG: hypothetical protein Q9199_007434 [Rusavskia elegans]
MQWLCATASYTRAPPEGFRSRLAKVLARFIWQKQIPMPADIAQAFKAAIFCGIRVLMLDDHNTHEDTDELERQLGTLQELLDILNNPDAPEAVLDEVVASYHTDSSDASELGDFWTDSDTERSDISSVTSPSSGGSEESL